jgi:hypothetical protein
MEEVRDDQLSFEDAAQAAFDVGAAPNQRERTIGPGITIRLERVARRDGLVVGEVVRVQRENIPPEARAHGLVPLGIGGLGHSVGFAYDPQSKIIAIQFDVRGVSLGRFLDYLYAVSPGSRFSYETVVNEDAWERYNRGQPRTLTLSIAAPENLPRIEGDVGSIIESSQRLAEISNAPIVTIEVSMGHVRHRNLTKRFVDRVIHTFTAGAAADADVRALSVRTKQEGMPIDTIDFVRDFMRDQETLDLPSDNHDENINRRLRYVQRVFRPRLATLRDLYA